MGSVSMEIGLRPVGWVENGITERRHSDEWREAISEVVIDPEYGDGLEGIEENSHIVVLFWLDRVAQEERKAGQIHPRQREELPRKGVFATRTARRPNPIGLTTAQLVAREGNRLRGMGLEALDGRPGLDIKPY